MNQSNETNVVKDGTGDQKSVELSPFGPIIEPPKVNGKQPFVPKGEQEELAIKKSPVVVLTGAALLVVVIILVLATWHNYSPIHANLRPNHRLSCPSGCWSCVH